MSCGAATQVNVTSLYFFWVNKRTRQREGGRKSEREREVSEKMFVSATVLLIFSCMVCVNIQVWSVSWDVPINTVPSFTTHRLYTSKINHRRQTYIYIDTRYDFFVLLIFCFISKYIPTHRRIYSLMSIIHSDSLSYRERERQQNGQ